jgi:hypothetical protein
MSLRLTQGDEDRADSPMMIRKGLDVVFDRADKPLKIKVRALQAAEKPDCQAETRRGTTSVVPISRSK